MIDLNALGNAILAGDRAALARAITLAESRRADHRELAQALLQRLLPHAGKAIRVGITGVPGVGKSTTIDALGSYLTGLGHKVAVLAVDPSSTRTGGSILGDKTRMARLAVDPNAYIRPSPSSGTLGGVAAKTRETMLLCEAAGFDVILVETVGVGQSEIAVADMVDLFVLMLPPGGGDELQGIKKGIVEIADLLLVNKADGDLAAAAGRTVADYAAAMPLLHGGRGKWVPPVIPVSALTRSGMDAVWAAIGRYRDALGQSGLAGRRSAQAVGWMWGEIDEAMRAHLRADKAVAGRLNDLEIKVSQGVMTPGAAARAILAAVLDGGRARP